MRFADCMADRVPRIIAPWFFFGGWIGLATPFCIFVKHDDKELELHEREHVRQMWRYWLIGFIVVYSYELIKNGYTNNKFEIEARSKECRKK